MSHALVTMTKIHMVRLAQDCAANGNMVSESSLRGISVVATARTSRFIKISIIAFIPIQVR